MSEWVYTAVRGEDSCDVRCGERVLDSIARWLGCVGNDRVIGLDQLAARNLLAFVAHLSQHLSDEPRCVEQVSDKPADSPVDHPGHYNAGKVECIDAIESALTSEEFRGFCKGNCIKYAWRERHKAGATDLEKAAWYLGRLTKKEG